MVSLLIFTLVVLSFPLMLASPLPRDLPFFVVFAGFWTIPRSQSMLLAVIAGALVDLFSPMKGLGALTYPLTLLLVAYLERTLLAQRSLLAFLIVALSAWVCIELLRIVLSGVLLMVLTPDTARVYAKAALLNILLLIVMYAVFKKLTPRRL